MRVDTRIVRLRVCEPQIVCSIAATDFVGYSDYIVCFVWEEVNIFFYGGACRVYTSPHKNSHSGGQAGRLQNEAQSQQYCLYPLRC